MNRDDLFCRGCGALGSMCRCVEEPECWCLTARDEGAPPEIASPDMIARYNPECPIHGAIMVPADLWAKVRNIPSDRLPTGTWEAIQAIGREGS